MRRAFETALGIVLLTAAVAAVGYLCDKAKERDRVAMMRAR